MRSSWRERAHQWACVLTILYVEIWVVKNMFSMVLIFSYLGSIFYQFFFINFFLKSIRKFDYCIMFDYFKYRFPRSRSKQTIIITSSGYIEAEEKKFLNNWNKMTKNGWFKRGGKNRESVITRACFAHHKGKETVCEIKGSANKFTRNKISHACPES